MILTLDLMNFEHYVGLVEGDVGVINKKGQRWLEINLTLQIGLDMCRWYWVIVKK